jgi:hypothetical protein
LGLVPVAVDIEHWAQAVQNVAARFLIVDAIDEEAATFYERYGFKRIPGDSRLFRKMSDIVAALDH